MSENKEQQQQQQSQAVRITGQSALDSLSEKQGESSSVSESAGDKSFRVANKPKSDSDQSESSKQSSVKNTNKKSAQIIVKSAESSSESSSSGPSLSQASVKQEEADEEKKSETSQLSKRSGTKQTNRKFSQVLDKVRERDTESQASSSRRGPHRSYSSKTKLQYSRTKMSPAVLLLNKQPQHHGNWNTMEVFDTLPTMYTKEKWDELKEKRRVDLSFEHLYWLSRYDPKPTDGHHLDLLINAKVDAARDYLNAKVNPVQLTVGKMTASMNLIKEQMNQFRNEIAQISNLRTQMHTVIDESTKLEAFMTSMDITVKDIKDKVGNMSLNYARRIGDQESRLTKLDEYVHKPNNILDVLKKETERTEVRISKKIADVQLELTQSKVQRVAEMKKYEEWVTKHDKFYNLNVKAFQDINVQHMNQTKRLEIYERIMSEFHLNIEAIKTHCLSTDLHLESTLPLQIAAISFEVGLGAIVKKQYPKFRNNFKKRIRNLEKNFQDCSDPFIEGYDSIFRKNYYELPDEYLNPTMMAASSSNKKLNQSRATDSASQMQSPMNKNKMMRRDSSFAPQEKELNELQNNAYSRKQDPLRRENSNDVITTPRGLKLGARKESSSRIRREADRPGRRDSRASMRSNNSNNNEDRDDIPQSISKNLLETLKKWQPVSTRWTIKELFGTVTKSVTEFLKIPMHEMTSEEFYSLLMDANVKDLNLYNPLPISTEQPETAEQQQSPTAVGQSPTLKSGQTPKSASKVQVQILPPQQFGDAMAAQPMPIKSSLKIPTFAPDGGKNGIENSLESEADSPQLPKQSTTLVRIQEDQLNAPAALMRLQMGGGLKDPRAMKQEQRLAKANELQQQAERRKLQEQVTSAIENVVNKVDIMEQKYQLRFDKLDVFTKDQEKEIKRLNNMLDLEKVANVQREEESKIKYEELNENIEEARRKIKRLVGELENSVVQQIKIPQVQILHTEYGRLQEIESKGVRDLLKRKNDIKEYAQANGGRVPKDDGMGIEIRKDLTAVRSKIQIVKKKIKKLGAIGKIPMGASMRIYHEHSDSNSSMTSESQDISEGTGSDQSSKDGKAQKKTKKKPTLLDTQKLQYQPTFTKVVQASSKTLHTFADGFGQSQKSQNEDSDDSDNDNNQLGIEIKQQINKSNPITPQKSTGKQSAMGNMQEVKEECESVGSIGELDSRSVSITEKSLRVQEHGMMDQKKEADIVNVEDVDDDTKQIKSSLILDKFDSRQNARKPPTSQQSQSFERKGLGNIKLIPTDKASQFSTKNRYPPSKSGSSAKFQSSDGLHNIVNLPMTLKMGDASNLIKSATLSREGSSDKIQNTQNLDQKSNFNQSEMRHQEHNSIKEEAKTLQFINYGSKKASNQYLRNYNKVKRLQKAVDAETQTDPISIGDIQLDLSDDEEYPHDLHTMKVEQGTDAPKFLILHIVPGRPEPEIKQPQPNLKPRATLIKDIVSQMKVENLRKGTTNINPMLSDITRKFALLKGEGQSEDVVQIKTISKQNQETYTVLKQHQKDEFFKKILDEQHKLKDAIAGKDDSQEFEMTSQEPQSATLALNKKKQQSEEDKKSLQRSITKSRKSFRHTNKEFDDGKSHVTTKSKRHTNKEFDDGKSHVTTKSKLKPRKRQSDVSHLIHQKSKKSRGKSTGKSVMSKTSRKTDKMLNIQSSTHGDDVLQTSTHKDIHHDEEVENEQKASEPKSKVQAAMEKVQLQLEKIENNELDENQDDHTAQKDSFINSSFEVSSDESEEDDYVTFNEFEEFKKQIKTEYDQLKEAYKKSQAESAVLIKKIDKVDWTVINQAETKLSETLGDFQLSVDGLLIAIQADIKRWKSQQADLESKYETISASQKNILECNNFLRQEFLSHSDDNWILQQKMINFAQMQVALAIADEVDKNNISLVGQKDPMEHIKHPETRSSTAGAQTIALDPSCKSCQCQSIPEKTALLQSLKLACLMYNPTKVELPHVQQKPMMRTQVVDLQRRITDELIVLTHSRRSRIENFRSGMTQLDSQQQEMKLSGLMSPQQSSPKRFLQDSDDKTFQTLNYLGLGSEDLRRHPNLNISITNNNTSLVVSPTQEQCFSPISPEIATLINHESQVSSVRRKPIIQGKIDSRAILGLKKNLNTASNFSQIINKQQELAKRQDQRDNSYKLSHKSAANLGYSIKDYKTGDSRYKMTATIEPGQDLNNANTISMAAMLQKSNFAQSASSSVTGMATMGRTSRVPNTATRLNPIQKRRQVSSKPRQTSSPQELQREMMLIKSGDILDANSSQGSMPKTARNKPVPGMRFSQDENQLELPQLNHNDGKMQSQVIDAWPDRSDDLRQSLNIQTHQEPDDQKTHKRQNNHMSLKDRRDQKRVSSSLVDGESLPEQQFLPPGSNIKVQVRNSNMFGPSQSKVITDEEIRAARRNVVTGQFRPVSSSKEDN